VGPSLAEELVIAFLRARFSNAERHARRLAKIIGFEKQPARA
jgi:ribose 5-phosphate isomerase RpiB